ncbi:glutaredoxin family protein [Variovorax terrae]|uniref:Glutaredoxin family protein n=1 Tax=Variovorax terrae TaxID=2923278 RepID=A0A9X1W025_9BURK|nr:glutaredoxin family protein [Variovorax terrae]MCJ0763613.1 glutaredoxin family protein [Variovorax terrae]
MKRNATLFLAAGALLMLAGASLQAQPVYRIVGPDGRVTYSDQPPPPSAAAKATSTTGGAPAGAAGGNAALPFELRQVASRYPVTLYTGDNCGPCGAGRTLLSSRGVPFTERTVNTPDDTAALQRLSGDNSLPFVTIGGQQIKGFSDTEWAQFLDAAGYPQTSQLPAGYRNPPAAPLVAAQKQAPKPAVTEAAADGARGTAAPRPAAPPPSNAGNPAGIKF